MLVFVVVTVVSAISFLLGFVVGRAQALSILDDVEKMLSRQIPKKAEKSEVEEDPWKN